METGKSRIAKVLAGEIPDRVPLDIGGINNTTMHWKIEQAMKEILGLPYKEPNIHAIDQQVVIPDDSLLEHFEADTRCLYIDEDKPWRKDDKGVFYDQWGIGRVFDGTYYTMTHHPLGGKPLREALDSYEWPDPYSEARIAGLEERAKSYDGKYCLILEGMREVGFGTPSWMRGMSDFYMDLAAEPDAAGEFLDKYADWAIKVVQFALSKIGKYVDIVKIGDDLGTQSSLIISPDMYREMVKPRQARVVEAIKNRGPKVLLHSCGAVRPIIDDFIDIGLCGLNPVQISASGMIPAELKEEFGDRIVFWGGGIDTQIVLPKGTPEEVKAEVKKNMNIFKEHGRYVFAPVHNIQHDVPVRNVIAMYEAYLENRDY